MVGRPAPLSARERGSSPAVGPTSILCTLDLLVLRSVSPLVSGGPGLWEAPQGLPDWVPPSLRELVFWSRRRGSTLSVGHFSPFPSEARCRPVGSRRPIVEVRTEARGCGRVLTCVKAIFRPPQGPRRLLGPLRRRARDLRGHLLSWPGHAPACLFLIED
ncbi:hypothetical protein NDU88_002441 [Pleurodeles waltl]|uniref:Uncharacterized protein n=1 Tax=Pleurodeles waltl TaxID=8319 RepID=A0AAV7P9P2_PLEWA|nr:hypothetical protein NDU88_002441 [Pleurodeles waltl]